MSAEETSNQNAIGIIEFNTIPIGMKVMNILAKNIYMPKLKQQMISGGRYIGTLFGDHASLDFALNYALDTCVDDIFEIGWLGSPHPQMIKYMQGNLSVDIESIENMVIIQLSSHAKLLELTNDLLHHVDVKLVDINVKDYLDGSSLAIFSGTIAELMLICERCSLGELITNVDPKIKNSLNLSQPLT